jgi:type II secretory pathway pseudopilin PulG
VVIGIIVLLVGILLPVVNGVRKQAYGAASANQVLRITSAMEAYNGDHRAYPGPFSNDQINTNGGAGFPFPGTLAGQHVTMTENVVLGLVGGLKLTPAGTPEYDVERVASRLGPMSLNPAAPKGGSPYIQVAPAEFSLASIPSNTAKFRSEFGGPEATDSPVPEFLDHYPDPLPVLILRARKGAPGVVAMGNAPKYQYDLNQILDYTKPVADATATKFNGRPAKTGIGGNPTTVGHGLQQLGQAKLITAVPPAQDPWGSEGGSPAPTGPPYDGITYFMSPQLTPGTPAPTNATGTPRHNDG